MPMIAVVAILMLVLFGVVWLAVGAVLEKSNKHNKYKKRNYRSSQLTKMF